MKQCWKFVRSAAQFAEEFRLDSELEGGTILQPVVPAICRCRLPIFSKISDAYENVDVSAHSWPGPGFLSRREVVLRAQSIALCCIQLDRSQLEHRLPQFISLPCVQIVASNAWQGN